MIEGLVTRVMKDYLIDYLDNFDQKQLNISLLRGKIDLKNLQLNNKILDNLPIPVKMKYGRIGSVSVEIPSLLQLATGKKKGDDEEMNRFVLQIIQNIQVTIERVYVRIEDPLYPFALGVLLPSIQVETTDQEWKCVKKIEHPEIVYKSIQAKNFSIFIERDQKLSKIDEIINLQPNQINFEEERERQIYGHIRDMFENDNNDKLTDYIIKRFNVDVRIQIIIDKARANKKQSDKKMPDLMCSILFGGLFVNPQDEDYKRYMSIKFKEDHINALLHFVNFTGLYNTFRLGVLKTYYEREFNQNNGEIQKYIKLYENYQIYKIENATDKMEEIRVQLDEIEQQYREDILILLRKAINERFYGLRRVEEMKQSEFYNLQSVKQRVENAGILSKIPIFRKKTQAAQDVIQESIEQGQLPEDKRQKAKQIEFRAAFMKLFYNSRYKTHLEEIELISKDKFDPSKAVLPPSEQYVMCMVFQLPKISIKVFSDEYSKENKIKPVLYLVCEDLKIEMLTEQKPEYLKLQISLGNFYVRDFYTPQPALVFVLQTIIPLAVNEIDNKAFPNAIEVTYEQFPKNSEVANSKLKMHTFRQLCVYANMVFATTMIKMTTRVFAKMSESYQDLVKKSPERIKQELGKGSFYEEMLKKMIQNQQEQIYTNIQKYTYGDLDPPKMDLDIYFISPKIIIHESLLHDSVMYQHNAAAVIIDLGLIEASTSLIKKERHYDYNQCQEVERLYDTQTVKFGKLKIVIDHKLQLFSNPLSEKHQNWQLSLDTIDVTNEFNFGFELKTCLTPFHGVYPAQLINVKIKELSVYFSRTTIQTLLRFYALYQHGNFQRALNLFMKMESNPEPLQNEDDMNNAIFETSFIEESKRAENQRSDNNLIENNRYSNFKRKQSTLSNEPEPQPKKAINIEVNFILLQIKLCMQDVLVPSLEPDNEGLNESFISKSTPRRISQEKSIIIRDVMEFGMSALRGKLIIIPKEKTDCKLFLRRIYACNSSSEIAYSYLILNPFLEFDEDVALKSPGMRKNRSSNSNVAISQKYNKYFGEFQKQKISLSKNIFNKETTEISFTDFNSFSPEKERLSQNNQLTILYDFDEKKQHSNLKLIFSNLRVVFIIPDLKKLYRFYIDLMKDMVDIEDQVKKFYRRGLTNYNIKKEIQQDNKFNRRNSKRQALRHMGSNEDNNVGDQKLKKAFTLPKKYKEEKKVIDQEADEAGDEPRGLKFTKAFQSAKAFNKAEELQKEKEDKQLPKDGYREKKRKTTSHMEFEFSTFEILVPSNIYDKRSLALKISSKFSVSIKSLSHEVDFILKDKWETLFKTETRLSDSSMFIQANDMEIYVENYQDAETETGSQYTEKLYFMKPYDLNIEIISHFEVLEENKTVNTSHWTFQGEGNQDIQWQIGLKELNTYLVIFQGIFKFLNDYYFMYSEIDPTFKETLEQQKRLADLMYDKETDKKAIKEYQKKQEKIQPLDEVLINEGLLKKEYNEVRKKFQARVMKALALSKRQDYVENIQFYKIKGISFAFVDNVTQMEMPLITLSINEMEMKIEMRQFNGMSLVGMERFFMTELKNKPYFSFSSHFHLEGMYYNLITYAQEPFIETFPLFFSINQQTPLGETIQLIKSIEMLNINFTYGLACNLQKVIVSLVNIEEQNNDDPNEQNMEGNLNDLELRRQSPTFRNQNEKIDNFIQNPRPIKENLHKPSKYKDLQNVPLNLEEIYSMNTSFSCVSDVNNIKFINKTGRQLKFCLSIFGDKLRPYHKIQEINENIITLEAGGENIKTLSELESLLKKFNDISYDKSKKTIKIDFVINGFKKIKNVILQRNGIFGYYLFNEKKKRKAIYSGSTSSHSCILRIKREHYNINVYFESNVVMLNNTQFKIDVLGEEISGEKMNTRFTLLEKKVKKAPLNWIMNNASLTYKSVNPVDDNQLIFKSLAQICDPRIVNPYKNFSKIIKIDGKYNVSVDIFFLKTKTLVGQFLIVFHPILSITNLVFTDMTMFDRTKQQFQRVFKTNTSQLMYEIDPYQENKDPFILQYKENENEIYEKEVYFDLSKMESNSVIGMSKGFFVSLKNTNHIDQDRPAFVEIAFERLQDAQQLKETKYDNFALRRQIYSRTRSIGFSMFIPYIAINKTSIFLKMIAYNINQTLNPFSSVFIRPTDKRMQIMVDSYHRSDHFDINTFGVSGTIKLRKQKIGKKHEPNYSVIDSSLDAENQNILEIGTYFGMCPHPYSKTKVIKFLPRYVIINKLDLPIVIKEKNSNHQIPLIQDDEMNFNLGYDDNDKIVIRFLNFQKEAKIQPKSEIVVERMEEVKINVNNLVTHTRQSRVTSSQHKHFEQSIEGSLPSRRDAEADEFEEEEGDKMFCELDQSLGNSKNDKEVWSDRFPLSSVDDFQITVPNPNPLPPNKNFGWQINKDKIFVRVNISPGPEHDATLFISFTKPCNNFLLSLFIDYPENDLYLLNNNERVAFVLNPLEKDQDYLKVELLSERFETLHKFTYEIDSLKKRITKANPNVKIKILIDRKLQLYICTKLSGNLRFIHLMTYDQYKKEKRDKEKNKMASDFDEDEEIEEDQEEEEKNEDEKEGIEEINPSRAFSFYKNRGSDDNPNHVQYLAIQKIKLKGIGISFVNSDPKEIVYFSLVGMRFNNYTVILLFFYSLQKYMKKDQVEKTRRKIDFKLENMQLDNMTMRSFPVIVGPRKAFNSLESKVFVQGNLIIEQLLEEYKHESGAVRDAPQLYFLKFYLDNITTTEGKISSQRIKKMEFALQEININFHSSAVNYLIQFSMSLAQLITDDVLNPFMASETMYNYDKLIRIFNLQDEDDQKLDHDIKDMQYKQMKSLKKFQGIIGEKPPSEEDSMIEEEKKEENDVQQLQLINLQPMNANSLNQSMKKSSPNMRTIEKFRAKEEICQYIKPDEVQFAISEDTNVNKILVQEISIKAVRIFLTFRMQKLEGNSGALGMTYAIINFFSNFANITDANIYFSEIDITNAYTTMENIQQMLTKHYMNQGIEQIYKIFGSTDILGNPVGLIGNLGRGVEQLYSEPFQGVVSGDIGMAAKGLGKGVVGFASKSAYGVSNSLSKMSGTWYMGVKGLQGRQISESNLDNPHNIPRGIIAGTKGLGLEVASGIAGVVTVPRKKVKEQGMGCVSISKGTCQGIFGLLSFPFTGVFKCVHSMSTGIKNQTGGEIPNQRIRYPRYFDEREIMQPYNKVMSHAFTALRKVENAQYQNENILHAIDVSIFAGRHLERFKDRILILTDERVIYVQELQKRKANIHLKDIQAIKISELDYNKIVIIVKNGKSITINTARQLKNKQFVDEVQKRVMKLEINVSQHIPKEVFLRSLRQRALLSDEEEVQPGNNLQLGISRI